MPMKQFAIQSLIFLKRQQFSVILRKEIIEYVRRLLNTYHTSP